MLRGSERLVQITPVRIEPKIQRGVRPFQPQGWMYSFGVVTFPLRRMTFITALIAIFFALSGCDRGDHPMHMDKPAPDFTLNDGTTAVHLADFRGKIVLVNFWATWCAPCIEELPSLQALQKSMPQIVVLAISVDDDPDAYHRFLKQHQLTLLTVEDPARHVNELYGTSRFPETYVVDQAGRIRRKFISSQNWVSPEIVNYLKHLS